MEVWLLAVFQLQFRQEMEKLLVHVSILSQRNVLSGLKVEKSKNNLLVVPAYVKDSLRLHFEALQ